MTERHASLPCAASQVLAFWFGDGPEDVPRKVWFAKDDEFDRVCRERFAASHAAASAGELDHWQDTPAGALALIVLLDQLSRNIHRGTAAAFAQDARALAVARSAVERGFDRQLTPLRRMFVYLPFEHSEDRADQARSVALFESLRGNPWLDEAIDYAHRHQAVIDRFGRFPHRNAILGRESTAAELEYLATPGSGF